MTQGNQPEYAKFIAIPAVITLGITLLRLFAEFGDLPPWLASPRTSAIIMINEKNTRNAL